MRGQKLYFTKTVLVLKHTHTLQAVVNQSKLLEKMVAEREKEK